MAAHLETTAPFSRPDFGAPIDVEAYLRACPASATTRGTFFQFVVESVEKEKRKVPDALFEGIASRRWVSWSSYPVADFMRLAINAAGIVHTGLPLGEGLRRIGWMAYPSFAATMAGRVVIYAFGEDLEALMMAVPRAYSVSISNATVTSHRSGASHWRVGMRDVYNFVDTYQLGVIEGAVRARGFTPQLQIRKGARKCDADFDVRW